MSVILSACPHVTTTRTCSNLLTWTSRSTPPRDLLERGRLAFHRNALLLMMLRANKFTLEFYTLSFFYYILNNKKNELYFQALSILFHYLIQPISLAFCGHLGPHQLSAVAMAISVIYITCVSFGRGLAFGGDTYFSQVGDPFLSLG